ncbi:gp300 [Sphingomonas phage PAU]|uniref:gp300 n=1 Tax=Sphingomonas phage PAU TaxID=1150991 RepID=UPI00025734AB|nr:gp300 [Sphingomonas phage PAU]AFF28297.1 gp300 [Sphingomonas phage PAU]
MKIDKFETNPKAIRLHNKRFQRCEYCPPNKGCNVQRDNDYKGWKFWNKTRKQYQRHN